MEQKEIVNLLRQVADEQQLENYDITVKPTSSGGANYSSNLFVATISSANKDDLCLFIKTSSIGGKMRESTLKRIYDKENFFYTVLKTTYRRLEEKNGVTLRDGLGIVEYYGASTVYFEKIIVFEDLARRGLSSHDRMLSVDWEYAAAAVTELAKLHALSHAYELEDHEDFAKTIKYLKIDFSSVFMATFWNDCKKNSIAAVHEHNRIKLAKFLDAIDINNFWELFNPVKHQVLTHGDFRVSNLLHGRRNDGTLEVVAVDYQTICGGSPVVDLYYFIFTGTDAAFRAKYYEKLLDHYYAELSAAMKRLGLNPQEMYSKQDYEVELKEKLPFGLAVSVFVLPIVTVEAENAPKVDENLVLSDFSIQKTGSLFPERMNGVVDDFVRWGVI